ncbi:MAG: hypothetical protein A3J83_07990 [Elusimicrobia bacterium RIFOXYA2_FULL_40_6]|nr:MAG: hypothetical protein A3J83_07990 [Elusimicrobia bacterium RIFOXYA2_FULL_40_6]
MPSFDMPLEELRKYKPKPTRKSDFSKFWETSLKELKKEPLNAIRKALPSFTDKVKIYEVRYQGFRGAKVTGRFFVPNKKGKFPVILYLHGYNGPYDARTFHMMWPLMDVALLEIHVRGQAGGSVDNTEYSMGAFSGHMTKGINDKEEYYYRGVHLDSVRALDYLCKCEEIDSKRIGVVGGSQGGGMTLITCGLDPRPKVAIAEVPFLSHFDRAMEICGGGPYTELTNYICRYPKYEQQIHKTLTYFDTLNFADRIKCPTLLSVGLMDATCPSSTVFGVYNNLKCKKEIIVNPFSGHDSWMEIKDRIPEWVLENI